VDVIEPASLRARVKADVAAAFERLHPSTRRRKTGPLHETTPKRG
jgi:hypothetical protein